MLVDWFTVAAQVVNFLVLVWLLKRFLYQPVLDAIDAREKRVASSLAEAAAKAAEAGAERDAFRERNAKFDEERSALLNAATEAASAERQRLVDEARRAADELRDQRRQSLLREQQSLADELARRTRTEVFAIARRTLGDLAGTSLEERMVEVFTERLRKLDDEEKKTLGASLQGKSARIRSAFELASEQRAKIQSAVEETFGQTVDLQYDTASEVIGGIEFVADGRKVAWSIADYLQGLENSVGELMEKRSETRKTAS